MSPSEKVRALLDERGIEHDDNDANMEVTGVRITKWDNGGKREVRYEEWRNGTTRLDAGNVSPEQAIAATVGAQGGTIDMDWVRDLVERHSDNIEGNGRAFHNGAYERTAEEIAATVVGVGTCKLVDNDSGPDMHCTACGGGVDDEYRYFIDSWGYSAVPIAVRESSRRTDDGCKRCRR